MNGWKQQADGTVISVVCTPAQEQLCTQFCEKYTVRYRAATEGLYGSEMQPVTLSEYIHDSDASDMTCILAEQDGKEVVIGCWCGDKKYLLDGVKRHEQISGPGPQSALIWDCKEWMLVERRS